MMMTEKKAAALQSIEQFLYKQAEYCDRQQWDEYLATFDENAEFHIPQWDSEHVHTTDPKREMSLIYYASRAGLEDRVFRIRTGKSAACTPMPRTMHSVNNVQGEEQADGTWKVKANWVTHFYRFGESESFFGRVEYTLRAEDGSWIVQRKQAILLNDKIRHVLDFYHV
ncbi:anthranilate 1,2-dioxygenase small subunit [Marinomonas spartinae]|uniref:anthranilate 1,2-dioxygenase small subunit n=1 Tax=Marinomonas spartinae TaxID=1792290 RepID=UPI001F2D08E4|nr:anthranilate 1,2-dioxygenase small subunit [Marinomonas spartinae]